MKQSISKQILALTLILSVGCMAGCSFSSALTDIETDVAKVAPLFGLVVPIVCIAAPEACLPVTAANSLVQTASQALDNALTAWAQASAAAQPGTWPQVQGAVTALQPQVAALIAAAQVKDATKQAQINGIIAGGMDLLSAIAQLVPQIQSSGGTTQAAITVLNNAEVEVADLLPPDGSVSDTGWSPVKISNPVHVKYHRVKVAHSFKEIKSHVLSHLAVKTGEKEYDALTVRLAKQVKGW